MIRRNHLYQAIVVVTSLASIAGIVFASPFVRLPTGQILAPAGTSVGLDGTMAANMVKIPGKPWVAVICSGARQAVMIVNIQSKLTLADIQFQVLNAAGTNYVPTGSAYYGLAVSQDGKTLYVSRGGADLVTAYAVGNDGSLTESATYPVAAATTKQTYKAADIPGTLATQPLPKASFVSGVAFDSHRRTLWVAANLADTLSGIPVNGGAAPPIQFPVLSYPLAVAIDEPDDKIYVSSERDSALSMLAFKSSQAAKTVPVGSHPDALLTSADGSRLFVANGDSDTISILDTRSDGVLHTILLRPSPVSGLPGSTPTGLCLSPDQKTLYVTLANMDAVAVVRLSKYLSDGVVTGYIPVGWYPSAVAMSGDGSVLVVANAKGSAAVNPNRLGPNPFNHNGVYYDLNLLTSTLSLIPVPTPGQLASMTATVLADNAITKPIDSDSAATTEMLSGLPIKHVIYIIKENRTYDEVLGDLPRANGDPDLVLFGRSVTPNQHALSENFVTLDNFYCCAEVSADGWNWSTSGLANEYVQRSVPEYYSEGNKSGRKETRPYDYEGENRGLAVSDRGMPDVAESPGGYIWDAVKNAGLTYRDYGAFLSADGNRPAKPALLTHTDMDYCYFDLKYPDSDAYAEFNLPSPGESSYGPNNMPSRYSAWKAEFDRFVANGQLPAFELVRMPRDHTAGTAPRENTPQAMAADNDYAVGEIADAVSHSPYWKSTAIFVLEDDAQNGPDHVDCHRSTCYVISPYIKRQLVDHRFYNTDSVLRTIEILLHTKPMTRLDSSAHPIAAFTDTANLTPFTAIAPDTKILSAYNGENTYGATTSARLDFAIADDIPEDALNQILWHSIKGINSPMPAPRHATLGE